MALRSILKALVIGTLSFGLIGFVTPSFAQSKSDNTSDNTDDEPARVGIDAVITERAHQTVPVIGRLVASRSGVVSVQIQGVVEEVAVRIGDRVRAGDVMARISPNSLMWSLRLRAAEVESAKASLTNAKTQASLRSQELKRLEDLKKSAAFSAARYEDSQKELAKAESDAAKASAELSRATANLNLAQIDLDNTVITAPYGGVVSALHTEIGTYLNTGQPVVTLVDDTNMEIEADVPANRTGGLTPGTAVQFSTGGAQMQSATVRAVVPNENPLTRTRTVRFVPDPNATFEDAAANQTVSLHIPASPVRDVVTVHKDAVVNKGGNRMVFVVKDSKAMIRKVRLGEAVGTRFIVLDGLIPGEIVIIRGNERLTPGQDIQPNDKQG